MRRRMGMVGAMALGLGLLTGGPAHAADAGTIHVPEDFVPALSDTRATGHYELVGTGLRLWTENATSTDKVAEYVATSTPLAEVGEPTLEYTNTSGGGVPGFQLVIDFDGDGSNDGILVGEPGVYGADWWLNTAAKTFVKDGAPVTGGGSGSAWHGTLAQWSTAFSEADVTAFGFSLGSGVKGDGVLTAITFAGTRYTFAEHVVLEGKNDCKGGGWKTSTKPEFRNQGECVSSFASASKGSGKK
ncbi:hypothetical protein [Blastococcus aggregatus]|nr:hypothetical protein [Blastococcus aggregatus]